MARKKNVAEAPQEKVEFVNDETEIPQESSGQDMADKASENVEVKHYYGLPGVLQTKTVDIERLFGSENAENDTYVTAVIAQENGEKTRIRLPAYTVEKLQAYRNPDTQIFENVPLRGGLTTTMKTDKNGVTRPIGYFNPNDIGGNVDREGVLSIPEKNGFALFGQVNKISRPSERGDIAITMSVPAGPFKTGEQYTNKNGEVVQPHYHANQKYTLWAKADEISQEHMSALKASEQMAEAYRAIRNDEKASKEEKAQAYKAYKNAGVVIAASGILNICRDQNGYNMNPKIREATIINVMSQVEYNQLRQEARAASQQDEEKPEGFEAPSTGMRM